MAMLPLRSLGKTGIITDIDPFELPPEVPSFGKNVRMEDGKIERGGVFRTVGSLAHDPRHLRCYFTAAGSAQTLYVDSAGHPYLWTPSGETDLSPSSGWAAGAPGPVVTSAIVQNIVYLNRNDNVPIYRSKDASGGTLFAIIPTSAAGTGGPNWDAGYRCEALRGMNSMVVAFNINKGGTHYPTMVKWSNFVTTFNGPPPDWDITSTTSSAGENILDPMKGKIVDGHLLRDRMMVYGDQETWSMDYIGGNDIFSFGRLFDFGVINQNCVVEHESLHYVFGVNDIKKTDGIQLTSIADGKVRRFIYDNMDQTKASVFFTAHNPALNEIMFCFVSNDAYCTFPASVSPGCNRAAIYNYAEDCWYFSDLPYVYASDRAPPSSNVVWTDLTTIPWTNLGGSWSQLAGSVVLNLVMASTAASPITQSLRTFDRFQSVSTPFPLDANANAGAYLERDDANMDSIKASLRGYKLVSSIYPQGRISAAGLPLRFSFGVSDQPGVPPMWGLDQTFDQVSLYKLDYNMAGRFLSYRMYQDDFQLFTLTGFDADVTLLGEF